MSGLRAAVERRVLLCTSNTSLAHSILEMAQESAPEFALDWIETDGAAVRDWDSGAYGLCLLESADSQAAELLRRAGEEIPIVLLHAEAPELGEGLPQGFVERIGSDELTPALLRRIVRLAYRQPVPPAEWNAGGDEAAEAERLRQSLVILQGVIEGTTDAIFAKDREGRYLMINSAGAALLGHPVADVIGRHDREMFTPDTVQQVLDSDEQALRAEHALTFEECVTAAGVNRTYLATKGPFRNAHGEVVGTIGISRDITERKRVEAALRQSEAKFRALFEAASVGMLIVAADGVIRETNPAFERMLGYEPGDLSGQTILSFTHPEDADESRTLLAAIVAGTRNTCHLEKRYLRRDGEIVWANVSIAAVRKPQGELLFAIGVAQDVTSRKAAEAALREQNELLQTVFDHIPAMIVAFGPDDRPRLVNRYWQEIAGYTLEEAKHPGFVERIYPDALLRAEVNRFIRSSTGEWREFPLRVCDGSAREISWSNVRLSDGGCVGIGMDVSHRKERELQLQRALQALEHAVEGIALLDSSGRYATVNAAFAAMFGRVPEEMVGLDWQDTIHPEDRERVRENEARLLPTGRAELEVAATHANGSTFYASLVMVRGEGGQDPSADCYWMMKDVTERRELEQQLRQSQKMEAVGRLAGGVAHDFNNMLAVINGYAELLLSGGAVGPRLEGPLHEIRKAGARATGLTRQLLALSRKQILEPRVLDVNVLVADLDRMLRRLIGEDIELVTLFDPHLGCVKADPGQLEQVLLNLCVNARDAMPRGGRLVIETRSTLLDAGYSAHHPDVPPGRYVTLAISDTGCGMSESVLARIFEPFFTTKPPGEGTGLGLATVFGVVKQSGGHVSVESDVGAGTTFRVFLPEVSGEVIEEEAVRPAGLPEGQGTILLCEDECMVRDLVESILTRCGYRVLSALDAVEALRIAQEHSGSIDLLLTDVVMPRMSGRQLAEQLLETHPEMAVLFMSGYTDDAVLRHGVLSAEVAFLPKPFTPLALITRVSEQMATARRRPVVTRGSVLVVDDDRDLRNTLAELLGEEGYRVEAASSGERALDLLRGGYRPDVILLDLMMPGMNGWVFRMEQQKDPQLAAIPTLIVSAAYDSAAVSSYLKAEGSHSKPLNIPALLQSIDRYCSPGGSTRCLPS